MRRDYTQYSSNLEWDKHGNHYINFVNKLMLKGEKITHTYDYTIEHWGSWFVSVGDVHISEPSYGASSFQIVLKKGHKLYAPKGLGHISIFDENTYKLDKYQSLYEFSNTNFKELSLNDIRRLKMNRLI